MTGVDILQFLGGAGVAAVVAAVINAFVNRRKLSAEATEIITKASAGVVENIMKDNAELRRELGEIKAEVNILRNAQHVADKRERVHLLSEERWQWHMGRWHRHCQRQADAIVTLGGRPETPPPLWPEAITSLDLD